MKKFFTLTALILLGLLLRIICIDKAEGLWNDEYVSWMIASVPFKDGFIQSMTSQCHMPFYYLYLKLIMFLFGQSDIILRLASVVLGAVAIPVMYFVGKERSERTGLLCAGFTAISSFLIYYSQEVRLYSLLFLVSAFSLLFMLKLVSNPNKKNIIFTLIFNFLIIFTHTIGFVFVFFNLIFITIKLFDKYKKTLIWIWSVLTVFSGLLFPFIFKILTTKTFSQWWGHFTLSKIGYLFTDYFSPVMTNLTNAPNEFIYTPIMLITTTIAITMICKSLYKNKLNMQLFSIAFCYISVLTIAALVGKLVFITKYSIEIYPILIFLFCFGISTINNKYIRNFIIIIYTILALGYLIFSPNASFRMYRPEGHKIVADLLNKMELQKGDYILIEYYQPKRFEKYFDFSDYNVISIDKGNFSYYLLPDTNYAQSYLNGKNIYRSMFINGHNNYYENKLKQEIFDNMKTGQNLVTITLDSVAVYEPELIQKIAKHDYAYEKTPLLFMIFSYIKFENFYDIIKELEIRGNEKHGSWTLIKFTKLNK